EVDFLVELGGRHLRRAALPHHAGGQAGDAWLGGALAEAAGADVEVDVDQRQAVILDDIDHHAAGERVPVLLGFRNGELEGTELQGLGPRRGGFGGGRGGGGRPERG